MNERTTRSSVSVFLGSMNLCLDESKDVGIPRVQIGGSVISGSALNYSVNGMLTIDTCYSEHSRGSMCESPL